MNRNELEGLIAEYEGGFEEIQTILEDEGRSPREKLAAIADVVCVDDEVEEVDAGDDDELGGEDAGDDEPAAATRRRARR